MIAQKNDRYTHDKTIHSLSTALLMGDGYIETEKNGQLIIRFTFERQKLHFLQNLIELKKLSMYMTLFPNKNQGTLNITDFQDIVDFSKKWVRGNQKVYFPSTSLTTHDCLLSLLIFGKRKLDSVSFKTTIERNHIKSLSVVMEKQLKVDVFVDTYELKIYDVTNLFLNSIFYLDMLEATELAHLLDEQDKKKISRVVNQYETKFIS